MYNAHFGFSCSPFENTLDQQFLFLSESHEEVIAALLYFIKEKKSFALVCGDVGTGKTMIVHHLLGKLKQGSVLPIVLPYPGVEYIEILRYIAQVLKINPEGKGVLDLTDEVKAALTKASLDGQQVVLIIDEAHLLSIGSLEHIRLLSNIETSENKLLQILLIGQNEISHKLRRRDMRQLRQRINVNRFLSPMSPSETIEYIDHRLRVAGSGFDRCFEPSCKKLIYKMTGGVPRSINRLCDAALLIFMAEKGHKVTGKVLKKANDALQSDVILAPKESKPGIFSGVKEFYDKKFSVKELKPALAGGALVLFLVLGLAFGGFLTRFFSGENLKGRTYGPGPPEAVEMRVEKPQPPAPAVKSEEIPQPPGAEEKSASSIMPGSVTTQTPGPAPAPPEVLPKEGVMKIDTASPPVEKPSVEQSGPNPAPPEKTQAEGLVPNANRGPAQAQGGDAGREIPAKGGNPNGDAQNLHAGEKPLGSFDVFTVTVKKGETMSKIAAQWFPGKLTSGKKSILSANPEIDDEDLIHEGQILRIPK
ncbi:MAG: AAA family ATPase [Syntrophobacteraceae bacterium]